MSRKVKSVSFNLNDPDELELLEFTKQYPNFSNYVKRLIHSSMRKESVKFQPVKQAISQPTKQPVFDSSLMRKLL